MEEYDINTYELLVRRWKKQKDFGKDEWIYEIGEPTPLFNPDTDALAPSGSNVNFACCCCCYNVASKQPS